MAGCQTGTNNNDQPDRGEDEKGKVFTKWSLWSEGVKLRGANIHQRLVYPELDGNEFMGTGRVGPVYSQEDFNRLAAWGANFVNISHPGIFTEEPPYRLDEKVLTHLKKLVKMIGQADMFAVISFRTGPGRSEFTFFWGEEGDWFDASYYNDQVWKRKSAQDAWLKMWQETARQFKDNQYVVGYNLMVEPNANEVWLDEWDPAAFHQQHRNSLYDWNQMYSRIIKAVRYIDTEIPLLAGGQGYSGILWLPFLKVVDDKKTAYVFHQYIPHIYTHQEVGDNITYPGRMDADYDGDAETVNKQWLKNLLNIADRFKSKHQVITACLEFGLVRWCPGAEVFLDDMMDLLETGGTNHSIWVWDPFYKAFYEEVNAFNFRFGSNPNSTQVNDSNPLAVVVKKYWAKNKLRPSSVRF
jgi:hypothetical protein